MKCFALVAVIGMAVACGASEPPPAKPERVAHVPSTGLSGPPDAPGKLPMSEVEAYMSDVVAILKQCAAETIYEGKVSARVTIQPTGEASAVLEPPSNDPAIDDCMVRAFENATFPESERGQRFLYSYTF